MVYKSLSCDCWNGLQRSENFSKGLRDKKEGGISARKSAQMWGLSMKKSTLQARLNGRVTFDRRKGPLPAFFKEKKKNQFADLQIELANRGFGFSISLISEKVPRQGSWNCTI